MHDRQTREDAMTQKAAPIGAILACLAALAAVSGFVGFVVGYIAAEVHQTRMERVVRPLPVAWSNFGTCGAKALGNDFIQWTCRIDQ